MKSVLLCLLLLPTLSAGDPSAVTRYLINENASLLDIGIMRMQHALDGLQDDRVDNIEFLFDTTVQLVSGTAYYDYENDFIIFSESLAGEFKYPENMCEPYLEYLRKFVNLYFPVWFTHSGYGFDNKPPEFVEALARRVKLQCTVRRFNERSSSLSGNPILAEAYTILSSDRVHVTKGPSK